MGAGRGNDSGDSDGEYDDDVHQSVVSFADVERIDPALVTVPTDSSSQGPRRTDTTSTSQSTGDYESPGVVRSSRSDVMGRGKGGGERNNRSSASASHAAPSVPAAQPWLEDARNAQLLPLVRQGDGQSFAQLRIQLASFTAEMSQQLMLADSLPGGVPEFAPRQFLVPDFTVAGLSGLPQGKLASVDDVPMASSVNDEVGQKRTREAMVRHLWGVEDQDAASPAAVAIPSQPPTMDVDVSQWAIDAVAQFEALSQQLPVQVRGLEWSRTLQEPKLSHEWQEQASYGSKLGPSAASAEMDDDYGRESALPNGAGEPSQSSGGGHAMDSEEPRSKVGRSNSGSPMTNRRGSTNSQRGWEPNGHPIAEPPGFSTRGATSSENWHQPDVMEDNVSWQGQEVNPLAHAQLDTGQLAIVEAVQQRMREVNPQARHRPVGAK
jgi:hypothetical protein